MDGFDSVTVASQILELCHFKRERVECQRPKTLESVEMEAEVVLDSLEGFPLEMEWKKKKWRAVRMIRTVSMTINQCNAHNDYKYWRIGIGQFAHSIYLSVYI